MLKVTKRCIIRKLTISNERRMLEALLIRILIILVGVAWMTLIRRWSVKSSQDSSNLILIDIEEVRTMPGL